MKTLNDLSTKNIYRERRKANDRKLYSLLLVIAVVIFILLATLSTIGFLTYKNLTQKANVIDTLNLEKTDDLNIVRDGVKDIYNNSSTVRTETRIEINSNTTTNKDTEPQCYNYKIEIEGLESEYCYQIDTFTYLVGKINEYNNTLYDIEEAQRSIEASCSNEFFANECISAKNKLSAAQSQKTTKFNEIKEITSKDN